MLICDKRYSTAFIYWLDYDYFIHSWKYYQSRDYMYSQWNK